MVLNLIFKMAGIIAQKIPPIIPPKIIKGKINQASKGYKANPILPLNNAPIIYCPSAPIFQIFALKPKDKPSAIRINGAALITNWGLEYSEKVGLIIGSQNINLIASNGFLPILKNKKPPKIIVKITAITGALTSRKFDRFFLGSILSI